MNTKIVSVLLAVILFISLFTTVAVAADNDQFDLGTGLRMTEGRFACFPMDDDSGAVLIMDPMSGGMLYTTVMDAGMMAETEDALIEIMLSEGQHELNWATLNVSSKPQRTNETTWTIGTSIMEGETYDTVIGVNGTSVIMGLSMGMTEKDIREIMGSIHRYSSYTPGISNEQAYASMEMLPGFYDFKMPSGLDQDINLILTPQGHGRLINSSGSITFDYTVKNGKIIVNDGEIEMWLDTEGGVNMTEDHMHLRFVKRENVSSGAEFLLGSWKVKAMIQNGQRLDGALLALGGVQLEMTIYENGSVDWHAVTDEDFTVAQGWGIDSEGYYLKNGADVCRLVVDGNDLRMTMTSADQTMIFERNPLKSGSDGTKKDQNRIPEEVAPTFPDMQDTGNGNEVGTKKSIIIINQPDNIVVPVGYGKESAVRLFSVTAQGTKLQFTWQKYEDRISDWINIPFDKEGNNSVFGLSVSINEEKGYSELCGRGVTNTAFGMFRCLISDGTERVYTDIVYLKEGSLTGGFDIGKQEDGKNQSKPDVVIQPGKENAMIFCPECGQKISAESKFCMYCGSAIHWIN